MTTPRAILASPINQYSKPRITHFVIDDADEVWGATIYPSKATLVDVSGREWAIVGQTTHMTPRGEEIPAVAIRLVDNTTTH